MDYYIESESLREILIEIFYADMTIANVARNIAAKIDEEIKVVETDTTEKLPAVLLDLVNNHVISGSDRMLTFCKNIEKYMPVFRYDFDHFRNQWLKIDRANFTELQMFRDFLDRLRDLPQANDGAKFVRFGYPEIMKFRNYINEEISARSEHNGMNYKARQKNVKADNSLLALSSLINRLRSHLKRNVSFDDGYGAVNPEVNRD